MTTSLTVFRYPVWAIPLAWLSMGVFRFPLWINRRIRFYKLMGCGLNGTFDKKPDLRQWAILATHDAD
ncbi:MAG TPA: spheroidene monooxygenase, partial [Ferruginibacter sp.]|nr:spheroidene monooxygenase [Ferruginibacter sp.]